MFAKLTAQARRFNAYMAEVPAATPANTTNVTIRIGNRIISAKIVSAR